MASGIALVAASPYPPPRSRETILIPGCSESQACTVAVFRLGNSARSAFAPDHIRLSVMVIPAEGPVTDTHNHQRIGWHHGSSSHDPQQDVVADGQHESLGNACCRSSAECQAQMMDNALQPRRATRPDRDNMVSEPLGKNRPAAMATACFHSRWCTYSDAPVPNLSGSRQVSMSRRHAHATKNSPNLHRVRGTALAFVHGVATRVSGRRSCGDAHLWRRFCSREKQRPWQLLGH